MRPMHFLLATKVSHDQYFLSQVATEFWSVAAGKLCATCLHHESVRASSLGLVTDEAQVYRDLASAKAATYGPSAWF